MKNIAKVAVGLITIAMGGLTIAKASIGLAQDLKEGHTNDDDLMPKSELPDGDEKEETSDDEENEEEENSEEN